MRRQGLLFCIALLTGCAGAAVSPELRSDAGTTSDGDAGIPLDGRVALDSSIVPCATNTVALIVERSVGDVSRIHVPVDRDGERVALLFDTGSALSFFSLGRDGPTYVPDAGEVDIGCDRLCLAGRGFAPNEPVAGLDVVGILGADYLLGATSEIDTRAETLTRYSGGLPTNRSEWPVQPFDDVLGHIVVAVTLDGRPVRLMVDTGSPHVLWLGEAGRPKDVPVTTTDAEGNELSLYLGEVELQMAGEERVVVPVLRAPSFPYLEETVRLLGGNIHGLLGLSALRDRSLLVDLRASELRLSPRE